MKPETLEDYRKIIDTIDAEMVQLFEKRLRCVDRIAEIKRADSLPILDSAREQAVITKNIACLEDASKEAECRAFFEAVMAISRKRQSIVPSH